MKHILFKTLQASAIALVFAAIATAADRLELNDGSVIMGKLTSATDGKFVVETSFAGTISISQDKVKHFTTDEVVFVGLNGGSVVQGKVEITESGIKIVAQDGR